MKVRSLFFDGPGLVSIHENNIRSRYQDELLVKTLFSGISAGTEMLIYNGQWPAGLSLDANISALTGKFSYPVKYGYAAVGRVIEVGANVPPEWLGRLVFAFNPHETYFLSRAENLIVIPDGVDPQVACLLPNMETAINLVMDGNPVIGESIAVFGQGIVGLLTTALLSRMCLAKLVTFEKHSTRRQASLSMGADLSIDPPADNGVCALGDLFRDSFSDDGRADLTYELSGRPDALNGAIAITGYGGRIVIGSFYGSKKSEIDMGGWFHRSRIQIISSQVSSVAPHLRARWSKKRRLKLALRMIGQMKLQGLITHVKRFEEVSEAYHLLREKPQETIQVILSYEENA
ncbi:MAG: zinc-dependent alcohol dehydrogenase [Desulfomonilaceae bacterium]